MVAVDPEDVFKDHRGRPLLNGAGAVKKEKKVHGQVVRMQRFVSNLIPANLLQERIDGDDKLLPYLGQLTLLEQEEDEIWLVDLEDFASCFNLFRLPACWYRFMAFGKLVDAELLGGEPGRLPVETEIAKTKPLPTGDDLTVIYLDSYVQLRKFRRGCDEVMKSCKGLCRSVTRGYSKFVRISTSPE